MAASAKSSKKKVKSDNGNHGATDPPLIPESERHKHHRRDKRKRQRGKQIFSDPPGRNTNNHYKSGDDFSVLSFSSSSTYSFIQSILGRRNQAPQRLPTVHESHNDDDDDDDDDVDNAHDDGATTNGVFLRAAKETKKNRTSSRRSKESNHSSSNNSRSKKKSRRHHKKKSSTGGVILLVLIGLWSNFLATHILDNMLPEEDDMEDVVKMKMSTERERGPARMGIMDPNDAMVRDDYAHPNEDFQFFQQTQGFDANNENDDMTLAERNRLRALEMDVLSTDNINNMMQPPPITRRFIALRDRLLSLYSEEIPSQASDASIIFAHPLFNYTSPQYHALEWLANVDKLRLKHSDPGLVQRYSLVVLYFSTGGPPVNKDTDLSKKQIGPWRNPTNFLSPLHECDWKSRIIDGAGRGGGIRRCDKNKTVVEISLYNELTGPIPSELGRLWNLRTLYLGRNKLSGTIPTELGMIQKLSSLSLQWNDLRGTIPHQYLKNLVQLRALQVEGNEKLSGGIEKHSLLCQMRNKYRGPTPQDQEKYTGRRLLRILTATCIPSGSSVGMTGRLECACCTECFGKTPKDLIYQE